jgi:DNA-binding ferritin-like protein
MTKPIDLVVDLDRILKLAKNPTHSVSSFDRIKPIKERAFDCAEITAMAEELKEAREVVKWYANNGIEYVIPPPVCAKADRHMKKWGLE